MKKKNSYIELLRFIMCILILVHHGGFVAESDAEAFFPSGALAADFFFMLTGYFAYAHLMKKKSEGNSECNTMKYWMKYTINKLKRVFPYAAAGILLIYVLEFVVSYKGVPMWERFLRLRNLPIELTFTTMLGIFPLNLYEFRDAPLWYLSAILLGLPLLIYLMNKFEEVFRSYIVWFLPALLQVWLTIKCGGPCPWTDYTGFFCSGAVRGFASMMMGCSAYIAADALKKYLANAKIPIRILLTLLELGLLALSIYDCHRQLTAYDEIAVLYMMEIMLIIAMSGISYTSAVQGRFFDCLGKISMPIYCIHWGIYQYTVLFFGKPGYWAGIGITLLECLAVTAVLMTAVELLSKKLKRKDKAMG